MTAGLKSDIMLLSRIDPILKYQESAMKKHLSAFLVIIIIISGCNSRTIQEDSHAAPHGNQSESATKKPDDEHYIERTLEILQLLGNVDVDKERMTVTRQESEHYNRFEVTVSFLQNEREGSAVFHQETGALLNLVCFDFEFNKLLDYNKDVPEEKATEYYEMLPVPQGYVLTSSDATFENLWHYRFSRQISEGLYNQYEQVIVVMDTDTGNLQMCTVHDFPLADNHNQNEKALTQDEAQTIAQALISQRWPDWPGKLKTAEIAAVLPNWRFTEHYDENKKYPDNTNLAWQLTYENKNSETSDMLKIYIGLYSGELLGGDSTGLQ